MTFVATMIARPCALTFCFLSCATLKPAFGSHLPSLTDAYAVKSVGAISASASAHLIAIDVSGEVIVINWDTGQRIANLEGASNPSWSPNGKTLAFFSASGGTRQLYTWSTQLPHVAKITDIPGGISPNPFVSGRLCGESEMSWSPDSESIAFGSRLMGEVSTIPQDDQREIRVFDANSPLDTRLIEGVFKTPNYWDTFLPANKEFGERMKAGQRAPELGRNRLIVVNLRARSWSSIIGHARQYYCPSWSPDGTKLAATADTTENYRFTYFGPGVHVERSTLALFDMPSGREEQLSLPANRVEKPVWSADGREIWTVAEEHAPISSFPRILRYSLDRRQSEYRDAPGGRAVEELRLSRDGRSLIAKLSDRYFATLWRLDPKSSRSSPINTFDTQVDSYDEVAGGFIFNMEGGQYKGRIVLATAGSRETKTLFDANPQLMDVTLGQQRRITWTNSSGEERDGIVIVPPNYDPSVRYPVILNPYPMPVRDNFKLYASYEDTGQLEASWGYVVFRPEVRAPFAASWYTHGEAYTERVRGPAGIKIMIDDIVGGIDELVSRGIADRDRIGVFGHSNGGWVTNILIAKTMVARAAVVASGVSNAVTLAFTPMPMITTGRDPATNGNVFDNLQDYIELSPIFSMRDVSIPILLTVGDLDWLWVPQMVAQYGTLRSQKKDVELVRYATQGHSLADRRSIEDALDRMHVFFDANVMHAGHRDSATQTPSIQRLGGRPTPIAVTIDFSAPHPGDS